MKACCASKARPHANRSVGFSAHRRDLTRTMLLSTLRKILNVPNVAGRPSGIMADSASGSNVKTRCVMAKPTRAGPAVKGKAVVHLVSGANRAPHPHVQVTAFLIEPVQRRAAPADSLFEWGDAGNSLVALISSETFPRSKDGHLGNSARGRPLVTTRWTFRSAATSRRLTIAVGEPEVTRSR